MKFSQKISMGIAIFIALLIFFLSSLSLPASPYKTFSYSSFLYHFGIFFFLSSFLFLTIFDKRFTLMHLMIVLSLSFIYAGLDELHQHFVPGRAMDILDLMVNFLGLLTGAVVVGYFRK